MNTELRKKAENDFTKDFFKSMSNSVLGNNIKNVSKQKTSNLQ